MRTTASPNRTAAPATAAPPAPDADADAFAAGVVAFTDRLRAFVRARVRQAADAEDITQDVMLKVFRSRHTLRDPAKLEAWLYRTARSTLIDHYRRHRATEPEPEAFATTPAPDFDQIGERLQRSVRRFVRALPDTYRRAIELADLEERPIAEVAAALGLSLSATKSRLARGRELLRSRLFACCAFEVDHFGRAVDFQQRDPAACECQARTAPVSPHPPASALEYERHYELARATDEPAIRRRLAQAGLSTEDLAADSWLNFMVARAGTRIVGTVAVETHDDIGWLRSLTVDPALQGHGIGARLVAEAMRLARQLGRRELWLLTTSAAPFFAKLGFTTVNRASAPAGVRSTDQFCHLCPSSAVLMSRSVAPAAAVPVDS